MRHPNAMADRFENPPLAELAAELRWGGPSIGTGIVGLSPTRFGSPSSADEEFFMRFGGKASAAGFGRIERLIPPGFPVPPFQVVYRFRQTKDEDGKGTIIFQVGPGVFTANITPPYQSWSAFRPTVETGLGILLDTRNEAQKSVPLHSLSLRYINMYGAKFTNDQPLSDFLKEKLGFGVLLPNAILKEAIGYGQVKFSSQIAIPLAEDRTMRINLGEGSVNNENAVVVDTSVSYDGTVEPVVSNALEVFNSLNDVHHRVFMATSTKLHDIMKPLQEG
jgi:uncharacterized protein (TIGR04255 family)